MTAAVDNASPRAETPSSSRTHVDDREKSRIHKEGSDDTDKPQGSDVDSEKQTQRRKFPLTWKSFVPFMAPNAEDLPPPYENLDAAEEIPLAKANLFSQIFFFWIAPIVALGYRRQIKTEDLWKLDSSRESSNIADKLLGAYDKLEQQCEDYNRRLAAGEIKKKWWHRTAPSERQPGLIKPLLSTFGLRFFLTSLIKVFADGLAVTQPFVTKALINYGSSAYYAHRGAPGTQEESFGRGMGLAFGLFGMGLVSSFALNNFMARSMQEGVLVRAGIIASISRRSMRLSGKARSQIPNSRINAMISADLSRIDFACGFAPLSWTGVIQLIVCIIILIVQLGVSSLAGVALLFAFLPLQIYGMRAMFVLRQKTAAWTDKRLKLLQELLNGVKIIKFFSWEEPNIQKIDNLRREELWRLRGLLIIRSGFQALAISMPTLAAVVAFLTFAGIGRNQDPAIIFTSLSLFNLLRMPLMMLPLSLATISDAAASIGRINQVMRAEKLADPFAIDSKAESAIRVVDADFQWETSELPAQEGKGKGKGQHSSKKSKKQQKKETAAKVAGAAAPALPPDVPETTGAVEPFKLSNINLEISRGELVAVVGTVGSGKSSLLAALIGEMRRLRGDITFSNSIAFCSQNAWIQNATLRQNVLFGQPYNEQRYRQCIEDACMQADLAILPDGDMTEIGEKGINLSGGQRQRVGIARALYYGADIFFFDDPLSAVDAHVGTHLFERAINGALNNKTRILVTHALHVLPRADRILVMANGTVSEEGTYSELVNRQGPFSEVLATFGTAQKDEDETENEQEKQSDGDSLENVEDPPDLKEKEGFVEQEGEQAGGDQKSSGALMQQEERVLGSVSGKVYGQFIKAARGGIMVPLILITLLLAQTAQVLASYWLVWWQTNEFNQPQGFYMGLYAMLGVAQAIGLFAMGSSAAFFGYNASKSLHFGAIRRVLMAPMSYFDTTPSGRIVSRFAKDLDTIDNTLNDAFRMALSTFGQVAGAVVIVAVVNQYFLIPLAVIAVLYARALKFYRLGARQIKQLDNLLRSALYAHFNETLSGVTTIRAYGEAPRFLRTNEDKIDIENRAYILTVFNQRWLAIRLDILGCLLVLVVAIISVTERYSINPSQIGLILSTIIGIQASLTWMIRQMAEVENDMNSSERLLHYRNELEQEAPQHVEETQPPADWPSRGRVDFENVQLRYREGLPLVLKGLSLAIEPGEKIGVVGRTGAGKTSILTSLLRIVEPAGGRVVIDGVDTRHIGLHDLRSGIAMIPQEAVLFNGTIRSNLDPFDRHNDATLNNALRCAYLSERYRLDSIVEDEGSNFSVGERSLVSLARALVKNSRIVCLDEATSSVDLETDSRIQATIRSEFWDRTLITIAHRLRTVLSYDRILVMDKGELAEFDNPAALFSHPASIFHSMCEASQITAADIKASQEHAPKPPSAEAGG